MSNGNGSRKRGESSHRIMLKYANREGPLRVKGGRKSAHLITSAVGG
jgi:hypothetical protein